jgi:hypothetical protein
VIHLRQGAVARDEDRLPRTRTQVKGISTLGGTAVGAGRVNPTSSSGRSTFMGSSLHDLARPAPDERVRAPQRGLAVA